LKVIEHYFFYEVKPTLFFRFFSIVRFHDSEPCFFVDWFSFLKCKIKRKILKFQNLFRFVP